MRTLFSSALGGLMTLGINLCGVPSYSQSIVGAPDGTGTVIQQEGNIYHIQGGTLGGNNLFHSFQEFGLNPQETAHFLSQPHIQNILGRVVGNNPSLVQGLIQLTGGNSNLFLLNEAGWIFTQSARLDVPGSFGVSTANQMQFEQGFFNASGVNDYTQLTGTPLGLIFNGDRASAIINNAHLEVKEGQSLYAVGTSVISTGTFSAPGGKVSIVAIPGENQIKISQEGSLLSLILDAKPLKPGEKEITGLKLVDIPRYLTGGSEISEQSGIHIDQQGTVRLNDSNTPIPTEAGTAIISGNINVANSSTASIPVPGIDIFAQKIALLDADLNASNLNNGGMIRIGGDAHGKGNIFNAKQVFVDAHTQIKANALNQGNGGKVIIWSDEITRFYGQIESQGGKLSGDGGFVEVSGKEILDFQGVVDTGATQGNFGTLLLDPVDIKIVASGGNTTQTVLNFSELPSEAILDVRWLNNATTNIVLEATNTITFDTDINLSINAIGLEALAHNGITVNGNIKTNNGPVILNANADNSGGGELTLNNTTIETGKGDITLIGVGNIGGNNGGKGGTGITLNQSHLITSSGNISLTGVGGAGGTGENQPKGENGGSNGAPGGTGGGGLVASHFGGTSGATGGQGGEGGIGVSLRESTLTSNTGLVSLTGVGGNGGMGGAGGGGGGGARNRNGGSVGVGEGGLSGLSDGLGGNGGNGGNGSGCGGGNDGCVGKSGNGGGGIFTRGGGGGGQGGRGGIGGNGSFNTRLPLTGTLGLSGYSGGGGAAFDGSSHSAGGGGGGAATYGGGGGAVSNGNYGGNGGKGGGLNGGNGGSAGEGGTAGGSGTGLGGNGSQPNSAANGADAMGGNGGNGELLSGNNGGGGGGAGGNAGDGGMGGLGIELFSGRITTLPGNLRLTGQGGIGGNGGHGGGGGGGGRGVAGGGGGGGGNGGNGGTGGFGLSVSSEFQLLEKRPFTISSSPVGFVNVSLEKAQVGFVNVSLEKAQPFSIPRSSPSINLNSNSSTRLFPTLLQIIQENSLHHFFLEVNRPLSEFRLETNFLAPGQILMSPFNEVCWLNQNSIEEEELIKNPRCFDLL